MLVEKIAPITSEIKRLLKDVKYLDNVLSNGGEKAHEISSKKSKNS